MADSPQLTQALRYATHGWPVFPVVPGEKIPVTPRGFKDASTDPAQIRAWWAANPDRNIGIATGRPGPDVVDVDRHGPDASGFPAWNAARREGLLARPMAIVRTPSGGMHAYYAGSDQRSASIASKHLDFRAAGGYVVAPHSTVGGKPYVVVQRQASAATVDFGAVRELVDPQPQRQPWVPPPRLAEGGQQNLDHLVARMGEQPEGNRNGFLHWAANRVLDHGQDERLTELANAAVAAGLDRREVNRTIESARQQERQDPHAGQQPRGPVRLSPPRELEPAPAAPASRRQERQEEPRGRVAVLEVNRDSPEDGRREAGAGQPLRDAYTPGVRDAVERAREQRAERAAEERRREAGAAPAEHQQAQAASTDREAPRPQPEPAEPDPQEARAAPFAQTEPEPEPEMEAAG